MNELETKKELSKFINNRRKTVISTTSKNKSEITSLENIPWYKRPLNSIEFSHKLAKDGKYYIRHKEWSDKIWIGPYKNMNDVETIIESYVVESLKTTLDKKYDESIHSVIIDNPSEFF